MANLDDVLQCAICLERMQQPKMLECQHTFCKTCLENMQNGWMSGYGSITCPECRNVHHLRGEGVNGLPNNLTIIRLLGVSTENIRIVEAPSQDFVAICDCVRSQVCCPTSEVCVDDSNVVCRTIRTRPESSSRQCNANRNLTKKEKVLYTVTVVMFLLVYTSKLRNHLLTPAKLTVVKNTTNDIIVQGMNLTITYNLFNIGGSLSLAMISVKLSFWLIRNTRRECSLIILLFPVCRGLRPRWALLSLLLVLFTMCLSSFVMPYIILYY